MMTEAVAEAAAAPEAAAPAASPGATEPAAGPESEQERTPALRCARCNRAIATAADLLPEQIPRLESASYPYQLDLLGNEEAWVYSATNPQQHRFDVCRFGPGACARLRIQGTPTADHSFFPPYAWRMAECRYCLAHLGWCFGAAGGGGGAPAFAGLVLTHLREAPCTADELTEHERELQEPTSRPGMLTRLLRVLSRQYSEAAGGGPSDANADADADADADPMLSAEEREELLDLSVSPSLEPPALCLATHPTRSAPHIVARSDDGHERTPPFGRPRG